MTSTALFTEAICLATALTVGLLTGLERSWHERECPEGGRVAGLRTFKRGQRVVGQLELVFPASPLEYR